MATTNSTEYGNNVAVPAVMNDVCDEHGRVRVRSFTYTQVGAGASGDLINLCKLPGGNLRVIGVAFTNSAFGAAGYRPYCCCFLDGWSKKLSYYSCRC